MGYRYETHLHTCQASACGVSTGAEHVRHYKELGYQGVFVTDHFFGGNTAAPRTGPWHDRIAAFCSGYQDALKEGQRCGLDVFFGWEQTYEGDDYLIYGLSPEWLMEHPEVEGWNRREQLAGVHAAGGCVIQAHPFRVRGYLSKILIGADFVDGIEIANAGNDPLSDAYARSLARQRGMVCIAGSDNHFSQGEHPIFGVELPEPLTDGRAFAHCILGHAAMEPIVPPTRFTQEPLAPLALPAFWLDAEEQPVPYDPMELFSGGLCREADDAAPSAVSSL